MNTGHVLMWIIHFLKISESGTDKIPGVYHMNKAYNLLLGTELFETAGEDIIDYTWDGRTSATPLNSNDNTQYLIPEEFRSIPTIDPSCSVDGTVNSVYYSSSSSIMNEQSSSSSSGWDQQINLKGGLGEGPLSLEATTQITQSLMYGNSKTTSSGRQFAEDDYTWSFSLDSKATLYKAEIDWEVKADVIEYKFKQSFIDDIEKLNNKLSNAEIMLFFKKWGTHVLNGMETGAYCKETMYSESYATETQVNEFSQHVQSHSMSYIYYDSSSTKERQRKQKDTYNDEFTYTIADIYCKGEVEVTSSCGGLTGSTNQPIVTSYEMFPIWKITQLLDGSQEQYFAPATIEKIESFIDSIYLELNDCSWEHCTSIENGMCTLDPKIWTESYINQWDGSDFSKLVNWDKEDYCFCNDNYYGKKCDLTENCACFDDENCCCNKKHECDGSSDLDKSLVMCNSIDDRCMKSDKQITCGKWGDFMECEQGIMTGACGSGGEANCYLNSHLCPSKDKGWHAIGCDFAEIRRSGKEIGKETTSWTCAGWGEYLSCGDKTIGKDLMIGLCGSGSHADCKQECNGVFGIKCADIDGLSIDKDNCEWVSQDKWGVYKGCPDEYVMSGYCGSQEYKDCHRDGGDYAFEIECCKLKYKKNL